MTTATPTAIKLLNTAQAAELLGVKKNTLEIWRYEKKGPKFRKVGALVRYAESDLLAYLDERTRTGTSHQGLQSY